MSVYRFARATAVAVFLCRYRLKIFYILSAIAVAFVTDWLYEDVASYLDVHSPQWALVALAVKTVMVYGALCFLLWQIRPSEWQHRHHSSDTPGIDDTGKLSKLTAIAQKEKLQKRRDAILRD